MKMNHASASRLVIAALAIATTLLLAGCPGTLLTPSTILYQQQQKNIGNFSNTVFLGDSLTAGYQSGSLLDTQQVHGWAPVLAGLAGFKIRLPLIAYPGAPAVLQLVSVGPPPVITTAPGTTTGRDDPTVQATDLAVPGAFVNDVLSTVPLAHPTTGQEQITQLVLGFPALGIGQALSQVEFAIAAQPTTIFLWAGNNDALVADETGMPGTMTTLANFTTQYTNLVGALRAKAPAHLVIANNPDVTLVPYLTPAAEVLAEYSAATNIPPAQLSALLGISAGDLVNPTGLAEIPGILANPTTGPITDSGVLTAAEVVTVQSQVTAFNKVIAQQAQNAGATLVDIHALFDQIATNGITINGYTGTTSFLGGIFALDGIHPTNTGYAVVANYFIDTMNSTIKTTIPDADLSAIAAADPLWPPNLAPHLRHQTRPMIIPVNAAKQVGAILRRHP